MSSSAILIDATGDGETVEVMAGSAGSDAVATKPHNLIIKR